MFWLVYAHGVLLLLFVGAAVAAIAFLLGRGERFREGPAKVAAFVADDLSRVPPAELPEKLEGYEDAFGVAMTVYGSDGRMLATSAHPPLEPARPGPPPGFPGKAGKRGLHRVDLRTFAVPTPDGGLVVARFGRRPVEQRFLGGLAVLAVLVVGLGFASVPLAKRLTRPLESIARAADRIGAGDLAARTGIERDDELGDLAKTVDQMAERLEKTRRAEKELLANVSHELRTPLTRLKVALELLGEDGDAATARRYLSELATDVDELERLVDDVLITARLELGGPSGSSGTSTGSGSGSPSLHRETTDVREVARAARARILARYPERSLVLGEPLQPLVADVDPMLLRRALENLLDNALKYGSKGDAPVELGVAERPSAGHAGTPSLTFTVADRGRGLTPDEQAQLFTPFYRGEASRARSTGGVGLGLVLVRRIVEAHGGTVRVDSAPNQGTTFTIELPLATDQANAAARPS